MSMTNPVEVINKASDVHGHTIVGSYIEVLKKAGMTPESAAVVLGEARWPRTIAEVFAIMSHS